MVVVGLAFYIYDWFKIASTFRNLGIMFTVDLVCGVASCASYLRYKRRVVLIIVWYCVQILKRAFAETLLALQAQCR